MPEPTLRAVVRDQGCVAALKAGDEVPAGLRLAFQEVDPLVAAFRHMVREQRYDVCEMALTTYLCAREHGAPITAIPAFVARGLHHGAMYRSVDRSITDLRELEGGRVGVNRGYTVTTGVWARGILADEHGVDLRRITWVRSSDEHVATYRPPPNVETTDRSLVDLLRAGEIDAVVGSSPPAADTATLVPDADAAADRGLRDRGLYPINHLIVVRDDLLRQHPSLGAELLDAFERSKQRQLTAIRSGSSLHATPNDGLHRRVIAAGWDDPLPFGVGANSGMLQQLMDQAVAQGILAQRPKQSEVFAAGTA